MISENTELVCADIYRQVRMLWTALEGTLPTWDHKFSILYGPPVESPPMFVIGLNPGGGADQILETTWPNSFWYADDREHKLPLRLQNLFDRAGLRSEFDCSTGANLNFFRTPEIEKNEYGTGWKNVPIELRRPLERYCRKQLDRLIDAMRPKVLFLMGWDALDQIAPGEAYQAQLKIGNKWLAVQTEAEGRPVVAIRHPTGARWSNADIEETGRWMANTVPRLLRSA